MDSSYLREGDVAMMVRLLEESRRDEPGSAMPWALLEGLARLVPCDRVSYQDHDLVARRSFIQDLLDAGVHRGPRQEVYEDDEPFWDLFWRSSCSWPQRTGDLRTVTHLGDFFPTDRERLANPMREAHQDVQQEMMLSLQAAPGHARRILFLRADNRSFTERDRQVLQLLQPHVEDVWLQAERRRNGVPRLTNREWEVLTLVASGMSHAEVAKVLYLSPGTVRKHMEHIRERLGVHSAAAAAARALPHTPARSFIENPSDNSRGPSA